jgi:hypothetical protein
MKTTLYNILEEHKVLLQQIEELDGELTEEVSEQFNLTKDAFESKAVSYGYVIKSIEDESEIIKKEIERLGAMKSRADKKAEMLRGKLSEAMQQFGFDEIKQSNLRLCFTKSKQVIIDNEGAIPEEYVNVIPAQRKPDKVAIKKAIDKDGISVPGAFILENKNLQIK